MPFVEARDGTRLYAKVWGDGPPVILIHGWPLSGDSWDPVTNHLADSGFKAVAYDRRGFGRSDQPSGGYDYDTFADDLASVIDALAPQGQVSLVGFSMGGGEVARYLARHGPGRISRVALVSSVVPYMRRDDSNPEGVPQEAFDAMTQGLLADRAHFFTHFFKDFFGQGWLDRPVSGEVLHASWQVAMQAGLRPTLLAARAFAETDFRPDLAAFTVPTLVIHGTADRTVPIDATARKVAAAVPEAQLVEYLGEAHGVFASQQERLKRDLLAFLLDQPLPDPQDYIDLRTAEALAVGPL